MAYSGNVFSFTNLQSTDLNYIVNYNYDAFVNHGLITFVYWQPQYLESPIKRDGANNYQIMDTNTKLVGIPPANQQQQLCVIQNNYIPNIWVSSFNSIGATYNSYNISGNIGITAPISAIAVYQYFDYLTELQNTITYSYNPLNNTTATFGITGNPLNILTINSSTEPAGTPSFQLSASPTTTVQGSIPNTQVSNIAYNASYIISYASPTTFTRTLYGSNVIHDTISTIAENLVIYGICASNVNSMIYVLCFHTVANTMFLFSYTDAIATNSIDLGPFNSDISTLSMSCNGLYLSMVLFSDSINTSYVLNYNITVTTEDPVLYPTITRPGYVYTCIGINNVFYKYEEDQGLNYATSFLIDTLAQQSIFIFNDIMYGFYGFLGIDKWNNILIILKQLSNSSFFVEAYQAVGDPEPSIMYTLAFSPTQEPVSISQMTSSNTNLHLNTITNVADINNPTDWASPVATPFVSVVSQGIFNCLSQPLNNTGKQIHMYINILGNDIAQLINSGTGAIIATITLSIYIAPNTDLSMYYMTCSPDGNLFVIYPSNTELGSVYETLKINTGIAVVNDVIVCTGNLVNLTVTFANSEHGTLNPRSIAWDYKYNKCYAIYDSVERIYEALSINEDNTYFYTYLISQSWVALNMPVGSTVNNIPYSNTQYRLNICNGFLDNINTEAEIQLVSYNITPNVFNPNCLIVSTHAESNDTTSVSMPEQTTLQPFPNYLTTGIADSIRYNVDMTSYSKINRASTPSLYSNVTKTRLSYNWDFSKVNTYDSVSGAYIAQRFDKVINYTDGLYISNGPSSSGTVLVNTPTTINSYKITSTGTTIAIQFASDSPLALGYGQVADLTNRVQFVYHYSDYLDMINNTLIALCTSQSVTPIPKIVLDKVTGYCTLLNVNAFQSNTYQLYFNQALWNFFKFKVTPQVQVNGQPLTSLLLINFVNAVEAGTPTSWQLVQNEFSVYQLNMLDKIVIQTSLNIFSDVTQDGGTSLNTFTEFDIDTSNITQMYNEGSLLYAAVLLRNYNFTSTNALRYIEYSFWYQFKDAKKYRFTISANNNISLKLQFTRII